MLAVVFVLLFALFGGLTSAHPVSPHRAPRYKHQKRMMEWPGDWPSSTLVYGSPPSGEIDAIVAVEATDRASAEGGHHGWGKGQWLTMFGLAASGGDAAVTAGRIVAANVAAEAANTDATAVVVTKTVVVTVDASAATSPAAKANAIASPATTKTTKTTSSAQSTATASDSSSGKSSDGTSPQDWVDLHNAARAKYGAEDVVWDDGLAKTAKEHAEACNAKHTKAAENLEWGGGFGTPKGAVNAWVSEASLYDWSNPAYSDATGHFTQVVWKDTKRIGCYIAKCAVGTVQPSSVAESFQTACEYDPAGNVVNDGQFAANVGAAVS